MAETDDGRRAGRVLRFRLARAGQAGDETANLQELPEFPRLVDKEFTDYVDGLLVPVPYRPTRLYGPDTPRSARLLNEMLIRLVIRGGGRTWWEISRWRVVERAVERPADEAPPRIAVRRFAVEDGEEFSWWLRSARGFVRISDHEQVEVMDVVWGGTTHRFRLVPSGGGLDCWELPVRVTLTPFAVQASAADQK